MNAEVNGILVAAHDLRTPLCLMRQLALSMDFEKDSGAELEDTRSELVATSERALRQVDDLARLAELEKATILLEPVSLRAVCDEVEHELTPLFSFNHKQLLTHYPSRTPLVSAHREILRTVIYQFCLGAANYTGENSLSTLSILTHRGKIRVAVRDFGPSLPLGIWKALKTGWLERPLSLSLRPGSSGLGLYIASRYSLAMHAQIGAVRHRDGSTFYVDLAPSLQRSLFE